MIYYEGYEEQIQEIRKALGSLEKKAPSALCNALTATVRQMRKSMVDYDNKVYANRKKTKAKDLALVRPKVNNPKAEIIAKGPAVLNPLDYQTDYDTPTSKMKPRPELIKVAIKKEGGLKPLNGHPKAFIAMLPYKADGETKYKLAVAERVPGKYMTKQYSSSKGKFKKRKKKSPKREMIEKLTSPSFPSQFRNEEVIKKAREIHDTQLPEQIAKRVSKILEAQGGK